MKTAILALVASLTAGALAAGPHLPAWNPQDPPYDPALPLDPSVPEGTASPDDPAGSVDAPAPPGAGLRAFGSERELGAFLRELARQQSRRQRAGYGLGALSDAVTMAAPPAPSPAAEGEAKMRSEDESVTNTQHAGVDEGGIVKTHGDYLVMLRRGRLFTVRIGDGDLRPVSAVDAFGPDVDPNGTWYDEMLVSGDRVVVIGFSYARGGTEIGTFSIDDAGRLRHRSTHHLRSNDYYSSRNYASRLIGSRLILYTPLYLSLDERDPFAGFPAMRRWHRGARDDEFRRIVPATRVYRPGRPLSGDDGLALHTVTVCDLAADEPDCDATAVLGPAGRVFYVSPTAVYVWVADWARPRGETRRSMLYRMPLDGSTPTAVATWGVPVDQFSFLEDGGGHLNVLVQRNGSGEAMWGSEEDVAALALLRLPLDRFGDGQKAARASRYRRLPGVSGGAFQNRFVGSQLLYGTGGGWGMPNDSARGTLHAVPFAGGEARTVSLAHGVDRIEAMGSDAVVVGAASGDLHFSGIALGGRPRVVQRYVLPGASQGETRSHGFFYKPDGADAGTFGLPVRGGDRPGWQHLVHGSASIVFVRNQGREFRELGGLAAGEETPDDACRASCVDWYGNARPLFLRGRVFALLGYEIVEGAVDDGRLREVRRISYAPRREQSASR